MQVRPEPRHAALQITVEARLEHRGRRRIALIPQRRGNQPQLPRPLRERRLEQRNCLDPGRDKLGDKPTPGQAALVAAVKRLSSTPVRFAGGHGTTAEYAPLAALAAQPQASR